VRVGAALALAPVVILAVFGLLVTGVIPASIWTWVATGLFWAALFVLAWITTPERDEAFTPVGVLFATLVGVGFVLSYYLGCRLLATKADWGIAVIDAFLFAATVGLGLALAIPRFRWTVMGRPGDDNPKQVGMLGPFGLLAVLFAIMTSVFASITLIAADKDLISLTARGVDQPSFEKIAQLYIWQFCKSVPLLDINETLRWKPPFIYTGTGTGTLVLLYKIAVIIPVIGAFLDFWSKQVEDPKPVSERPGGS
jgi:uncharacterized protein Usg